MKLSPQWQLRPLPPDTKFGWCAHKEALLGLVRAYRPTTYVELGTWRGLSASLVANELKTWGGLVYCVDTWAGGLRQGKSAPGKRHPGMIGDCAVTLVQEDVGPWVRLIVAQTADAAKAWTGPPIDLLYIDADHSHAGALEDLRLWTPHVRPGVGLICGDDYGHPAWPGVQRAFDQYEQETGQVWVREAAIPKVGSFIWGIKAS